MASLVSVQFNIFTSSYLFKYIKLTYNIVISLIQHEYEPARVQLKRDQQNILRNFDMVYTSYNRADKQLYFVKSIPFLPLMVLFP